MSLTLPEALAPGAVLPPLRLETTDGPLDLGVPTGKPMVLFFYPEDDTEGCTTENIEFSLLAKAFGEAGIMLVGISPDSVHTHAAFRHKHGLKVRLAADPDHRVTEAFGLWQLKKMFGVTFMGVKRATVLIDASGRVADTVFATRIKGHALKVLDRALALFLSA